MNLFHHCEWNGNTSRTYVCMFYVISCEGEFPTPALYVLSAKLATVIMKIHIYECNLHNTATV